MKRCPGNALLEMILYLPLVLMFLFVVTDAGLALFTKTAVEDAFRGSINKQISSKVSLISLDEQNTIRVDPSSARALSFLICQEVANSAGAIYREGDPAAAPSFVITAEAVEIAVDPQTGRALGFQYVAQSRCVIGALDAESINRSTAIPSADDFIDQQLNVHADGLSPFAVPAGGGPAAGFLPVSAAVYLELSAAAPGLNPQVTSSLIGGLFAIHQQQLAAVRTKIQ